MDEKLLHAYCKQLNAELYSAYLYLAMSSWCEGEGFKGYAHWMHVQAKEEMAHAMHLWKYIQDRNETPRYEGIEQPPEAWKSLLDVMQAVQEHEKKVTCLISGLITLSNDVKDYASHSFLQWYVDEQVEEEANASQNVQRLKIAKDNPQALLMLDAELATRVFVHPFPAEQ